MTSGLSEQEKKQIETAEEVVFAGKHTTGFVKRLFRGEFDAHRVFPYPEPSREIQEQTNSFVEKFRRTLDEHLDPDWNDRHATIPASTIRALADTGFLGLTIPKEYGGRGCHSIRIARRSKKSRSGVAGRA